MLFFIMTAIAIMTATAMVGVDITDPKNWNNDNTRIINL
jgi:hypothetical protein